MTFTVFTYNGMYQHTAKHMASQIFRISLALIVGYIITFMHANSEIISCCVWKRSTNVIVVEVDMCLSGPQNIPKFSLQIQETVKLFRNQ
jgi:hypothetical protein